MIKTDKTHIEYAYNKVAYFMYMLIVSILALAYMVEGIKGTRTSSYLLWFYILLLVPFLLQQQLLLSKVTPQK